MLGANLADNGLQEQASQVSLLEIISIIAFKRTNFH